MRRLSPGDAARKLALIETQPRSRRWKRRAKAHLLDDVNATLSASGAYWTTPTGTVCRKRRFTTFTSAIEGLVEALNSPNPHRRERRVYHCKRCSSWHITSKPFEEYPHD